jgi:ornithine decarboxylase
MVAERDGAPTTFTLAGPSCDSFDVIANDVVLPSPKVGDKVVIFSAGAYTTVYASRFNGYQIPPVIIH